ncbi:MAG: Gfo/Idh/MocA family protein [Lacipirellulaceae bacterium]
MAAETRVGLVGTKFMGKAHSNAFLTAAKFFDLPAKPVMKAVCGRDEASLRAFADRFGWESIETDWRKLVARDDIDLIDVGSPGDTHAGIAIAAAEAGKHVFCEKPLANTLAECREMLAAVRKAGVVHMVNFNYRRCPAVTLARQMIAAGEIGEVRHVRAVYLQDWLVDATSPMSWRLNKEIAGSGALGDLAAHSIDLARYLTGDEITDVVGDLKTFVPERPDGKGGKGTVTVDDASVFLARFGNGAIGTFEATRMAPGRKNFNGIEINGSRGSLHWMFEDMNVLDFYSEADAPGRRGFRKLLATDPVHPYFANWWPGGHILGYEHGFIHAVVDLVKGIAAGQQVEPDFLDGARCVAVLEAVERSANAHAWQTVEQVD